MQSGSTGLGNMTLQMKMATKAEMDRLPPTKPAEGAFVVYCKTHDPVIWNMWISFDPEDLPSLIAIALKPATFKFIVKSLFMLMLPKKKTLKVVEQPVSES